MKKISLLLSLFLGLTVNSQTCEGLMLLNEDFNTASIPSAWTIFDLDGNTVASSMITKGYTGQFQPYNHNGEKCIANISVFSSPAAADDYIVTTAINVTAGPTCFSWKASSEYGWALEQYDIVISSGNSLSALASGTVAFSQSAEPTGWNEHSLSLSPWAGQTVYIAIHYTSNNKWTVYFDDIRVSKPQMNDLKLATIDFPLIILPGNYTISGKIFNGGSNYVYNYDLHYTVNGGPVQTCALTNSVAPATYVSYSHTVAWNPVSNGTYKLKAWCTSPNFGIDPNFSNDTITRLVYVSNFPRRPLIEEFTNASCMPCGQQNPNFDALISPNLQSSAVSLIKYQCAWPGVDPMNAYNPPDVKDRVMYYGVSGIPHAFVNGKAATAKAVCNWVEGAPACLDQTDINTATALSSIFDVGTKLSAYGPIVSFTTSILCLNDFTGGDFILRNVIAESEITYTSAPGTNGETNFMHPLRKMIPNTNGFVLPSMTAGQMIIQTYSTTIFSPANTNSLISVSFIQDDRTQEVLQSSQSNFFSTIGINEYKTNDLNVFIFPNPTSGEFTIQYSDQKPYELFIYNSLGSLIKKSQLSGNDRVSLSEFESGVYHYIIRGKHDTATTSGRILKIN
jgi:hypothetical protein